MRAHPGNKKVFITIDDAPKRVQIGLREGLTEIGKENSRHTKKLIRDKNKTGRVYRRGGMNHQASAPGEAPASDTDRLAKSVGYRVYGWEKMEFGDRAPYGKWLADGTKKMAKRPHITTTVREKSKDNFLSLSTAVDKQVKKR